MKRVGEFTYVAIDNAIDLREPILVEKRQPYYPYPETNAVYEIEEIYEVFPDFYKRPKPASRHPEIRGIYFVEDSKLSPISRTGVSKFTRLWACLPGFSNNATGLVHIKPESFVYQVPGISTDQQLFQQFQVSSYSTSGGITTINSTIDHDIVTGKLVRVNYHVVDPKNGYTYYRQAIKLAITAGGATITISQINDINTALIDSFQRADVNQEPRQKTVDSKFEITYWLPGVNCASYNAIPRSKRFEIIDNATGNITSYLKENSTPTLDEYSAWIDDEDKWIQAEDSYIREWRGLIYQKFDRFVRPTF